MKPVMNSHKRLAVLLSVLAMTIVMGAIIVSVIPGSLPGVLAAAPPTNTQLPRREADGDGKAPAISFIDSPSATCYLPTPGTGTCFIQWDYLNVIAASGQYIISMTVSIDDHIRAYHSGFFQSSMYIPADLATPGYQVICGVPVDGDTSGLGLAHSYTIRARETTGLRSVNYGSVTCPADSAMTYIPVVLK